MDRLGKYLSLFLVVILAVSILLLIVKPIDAQTIPKPSVPEFTVKYVDLSYDVPTTTSIDQYTGKTVTTQGYHVENRTIQLTIKNQAFTSYIQDGQNVSFYYNVREKGQYAQTDNWITIYSPDVGFQTESKSDYTTLYFSIDKNEFPFWEHLVNGGSVDFQVQALIGSVHRISNITGGNQSPFEMFPWVFDGQTSDWSNTQTVNIPETSSSVSPSPTVPEFSVTVILPLFVVMPFIVAVIQRKRRLSKSL